MGTIDADLAGLDTCDLVTTGRVTGQPHHVEIWFALRGDTLYLLSGGGRSADWVRNLERDRAAAVELGGRTFRGRARVLAGGGDEADLARRLLYDKYAPRYEGSLERWRADALPVAVDLDAT